MLVNREFFQTLEVPENILGVETHLFALSHIRVVGGPLMWRRKHLWCKNMRPKQPVNWNKQSEQDASSMRQLVHLLC